MDQEPQSIIKQKLATLPPAVRAAIAHIDYPRQIQGLFQRFGLRIDQAGIVENEIMLVLLGLEHPDTLVGNLVREAGLSREIATAVANDIGQSVFASIRKELIEMHEKETLIAEILDGPTAIKTPPTMPSRSAQLAPSISPAPLQPAQLPSTPELQGIERTLPADIARTKLEQSFRLPPQNVSSDLPSAMSPKKPTYEKIDPYREPTA